MKLPTLYRASEYQRSATQVIDAKWTWARTADRIVERLQGIGA